MGFSWAAPVAKRLLGHSLLLVHLTSWTSTKGASYWTATSGMEPVPFKAAPYCTLMGPTARLKFFPPTGVICKSDGSGVDSPLSILQGMVGTPAMSCSVPAAAVCRPYRSHADCGFSCYQLYRLAGLIAHLPYDIAGAFPLQQQVPNEISLWSLYNDVVGYVFVFKVLIFVAIVPPSMAIVV